MKKFLAIMAMLGLAFAAPVKAQTVNDLLFYTEDYPPYNFKDASGNVTGISVDLLGAVLKKVGSSKTVKDIKLTTWDEAYNNALKNKNSVVFGTTRSDAREDLFKWVGPIAPSRTAILAKKGGKTLSNVSELGKYKVAVIKNDIGQQLARAAGVPDANFVEATDVDTLIKALESGAADFWVYEEAVARYMLKNRGKSDGFTVVGSLGSNDISYAFNLSVPDEVISAMQDAVDEIKASGEYLNITDKYTK